MPEASSPDGLARAADAAIDALDGALDGAGGDQAVVAAKALVAALRDARDYRRMLRLAEAVRRREPEDVAIRRLQAQALIESGLASVAIDVLQPLSMSLTPSEPEWREVQGLVGRAWKQIFFDAADKAAPPAAAALATAIAAYRAGYEADPHAIWLGVNVLALASRARRLGVVVARDVQILPLARRLVDALLATPSHARDAWFLPTLAEASLGLGDWDVVEARVRDYVAGDDVPAFLIASTLRQFTQVWDLESGGARGRGLVAMMRARLLATPRAELVLAPQALIALQGQPAPPRPQLEAVLGPSGPQTFAWWTTGVRRARSVVAIRRRLGKRIGTGFLVRAADFGLVPDDELLVLTNFHVVNPEGRSPGIRPDDAQVVFEAVEGAPVHDVDGLVWCASRERQDATLLRLRQAPTGIDPLPLARRLPTWPVPTDAAGPPPRVYVVGHPGGRELSFSFQDNELLGHEGPPDGRPPIDGVCRVHYRAPTEGGSSGSPVFDDQAWEVIALHHMGGQLGMPLLNGAPGSYAANEGIAMSSIVDAVRSERPRG